MNRYFKYAFLLFTSIFIIGCSSTKDLTKYYKLEGINLNNTSKFCDSNCKKVKVDVSVPNFLNSSGIVYYSDQEEKIRISLKNLWIEQLDIQLKNIVENKINTLGKSYYAYDSRIDVKEDEFLQIFINEFNGDNDGKASVSGTYVYKKGNVINYGSFSRKEIPEKNGFQSLIDKLNEMWLDECDTIIKEVL